jgi:AraC-like DNA-binding protein
MSQIRQDLIVRTFAVTFYSPDSLTYAAQGWDQLVYAVRGVVTVHSERDSWVLPAQRALWAPDGVKARIEIPGPVSLRSLYILKGLAPTLPRKCAVVNVSSLLRELILETMRVGMLDRTIPEQKRLAQVLLDQLKSLPSVPLQLPMPVDARAVRAAELMSADPSSKETAPIAKKSGASVRTLERLFRAETSMPLAAWRRRMRLLHALRMLAGGEQVTKVALESGYDSTSAFVAMFRRELGVTPARYFAGSR